MFLHFSFLRLKIYVNIAYIRNTNDHRKKTNACIENTNVVH